MNIDEKYLNDGTVQTIWYMFNTGSKKIFKKFHISKVKFMSRYRNQRQGFQPSLHPWKKLGENFLTLLYDIVQFLKYGYNHSQSAGVQIWFEHVWKLQYNWRWKSTCSFQVDP